MVGYLILGALAAFGLLSVLWALLGWLLPGGEGCAIVHYGVPENECLWRFTWLRSLGLLTCPLLAVTEENQPGQPEGIERCSPENLLSRLMEERNRFDGTGNGDHTGRGQRRDLSEL